MKLEIIMNIDCKGPNPRVILDMTGNPDLMKDVKNALKERYDYVEVME